MLKRPRFKLYSRPRFKLCCRLRFKVYCWRLAKTRPVLGTLDHIRRSEQRRQPGPRGCFDCGGAMIWEEHGVDPFIACLLNKVLVTSTDRPPMEIPGAGRSPAPESKFPTIGWFTCPSCGARENEYFTLRQRGERAKHDQEDQASAIFRSQGL